MARALIAYFSQNGSTAKIGETIAEGLGAEGYEVDLHNIKDGIPPSPKGYDLLGVGSPVYYFKPPYIVKDYVDGLPGLNGMPAFVYVDHGSYRGDTATTLRKVLAGKGARDMGQFATRAHNTFLGYIKEGCHFSHGYPRPQDFEAAEKFGREVAERASGKVFTPEPYDPPPRNMYRLERAFTPRFVTWHVYSKLFRVDSGKCADCSGVCRENCPMKNLSMGKRGEPVWGPNCLLCLTCERTCPKDAILSPVSWPVFRPFMWFNVYVGMRDPGLEHTRVRHKNGVTMKLE